MVKASISNGSTHFVYKGIGFSVIASVNSDNSTFLTGFPEHGMPSPTSVRDHATRRDALIYVTGALRLPIAA